MDRINVVVKHVITETMDAYSLVLEDHPELSAYEAGQFVNVFCKVNGDEIQRSYSFSSSPLVDPSPVLTIKKVPQGKMSNYLQETMQVGSILTISQPLGRFLLDKSPLKSHILLIAGGSGITPIFSLLKEGLKRSQDTHFTLLYANRNEEIIFHKVLDDLVRDHKNRLDIHYFLEEGSIPQTQLQVHPGRISREFLERLLDKHQVGAKKTRAYISGPGGMMENTLSWLRDTGFKQDQIFTEHFALSKSIQPGKISVKEDSSQVTLRNFKGGKAVLSVARNTDILSGFLDNGYKLPHSCREAMCGSCAAKLMEGQVEMKKNYALNDAKLAEGYVLLCQSLPLSREVVLEYSS